MGSAKSEREKPFGRGRGGCALVSLRQQTTLPQHPSAYDWVRFVRGAMKSLLYAPRRSCGRGVPAVSQARAQRGAAHAHFARPRRPHQKAITSAPRTRGACPRARPGRGLRVFAWLASVQRAARPTRPHPFSKTGNAREGAFSLSLNPEKAPPFVVASPFPMPSFFYSPPQRVAHQARVFHGLQGHDRDGHVQADALAI